MIRRTAVAALIVLVFGAPIDIAIAQEPVKPAQEASKPVQETAKPPGRPGVTALMVDVTLARYLGEKRLSSTLYALSVTPDISVRSSLRMGGDVPVPSTTFAPAQKDDSKPATPMLSYGYRTVGTNIDVMANAGFDGQYRITLTIEDSSIYPPELSPPSTKTSGAPSFRSFKSTNAVNLRDGQSLDYMTGTDRLTGEVYRATVKLTVVK